MVHIVNFALLGENAIEHGLQMMAEARRRGIDVSAQVYPYTAGIPRIESAYFDAWEQFPDERFRTFIWPATGERLTRETFAKYRQVGGDVIVPFLSESSLIKILRDPAVLIASEGVMANGKGHPRTAGTFARVLGRYVREARVLPLMEALRKMTVLPAQRLERRVPEMKRKGRVQPGSDADLTVFDPARIIDRSTYQQPSTYSEGVRFVLVAGVFVVKDGSLQQTVPEPPGRSIRAAVR